MGHSTQKAHEIASCIKENPGPLVEVIAFIPAYDAPITAFILANSSSACKNLPPS